MKLTQWTLFIDMLGYRDINGAIDSDDKAGEFVSFMEANREIFNATDSQQVRDQYAKNKEFDLYKYYEVTSCFVSDSLIITYKPKEVDDLDNEELAFMHSANSLFIIAMRLQAFTFHCYSEKRLFLRGGISNKYCHIKDNFAVGEGLIQAYLAESAIAIHPRIILHPEIQKNEKLMKKIEFLADAMYGGRSILQKDDNDGIYFIDHLGYAVSVTDTKIPMIGISALKNPIQYMLSRKSTEQYIARHAEAVTNKMQELEEKIKNLEAGSKEAARTQSVIDKFLWLKNYHNRSIVGHSVLAKYQLK